MNFIRGVATSDQTPPGQAPVPGAARLTVAGFAAVQTALWRNHGDQLDKGELVWQVAHGETPDNIRNNPALKGVTIPRTGRAGNIGIVTTSTLVISGEAGFITNDKGERGAYLRAYDKATGKDAGAVWMPAGETGSPMTYHAEWQAVHCAGDRRGGVPGGVSRLHAAGLILLSRGRRGAISQNVAMSSRNSR